MTYSFCVENYRKIPSTERVIPKQCRINPQSLSCGYISPMDSINLRSIIDDSTGLINAYEIDNVSEIINNETEKLFNLEAKYDLL